jgi:hypothetical protein
LKSTGLEINCTKTAELKWMSKALSRDENGIKHTKCLVGEAHGIGKASKLP